MSSAWPPNSPAAAHRSCAAASSAAFCTALQLTYTPRLEKSPRFHPHTSVSEATQATCSGGMPSVSATTCICTISCPLPISWVPECSTQVPSSFILTTMQFWSICEPKAPLPCSPMAQPSPMRYFPSSSSMSGQFCRSAMARRTQSLGRGLPMGCPANRSLSSGSTRFFICSSV